MFDNFARVTRVESLNAEHRIVNRQPVLQEFGGRIADDDIGSFDAGEQGSSSAT
ncbi:hypothetical protein [Paraburkholderia sp. 35.1]|uniref:hypothetical protein n=1 Tax=Paraburkholderia sp. 35.1 TaxID=2991058 RepID=UPI003D1BB94C